jgi:hypothetical protein
MQTKTETPVETPARERPLVTPVPTEVRPLRSAELGANIQRLQHEEQIEIDRRRQDELARLRAIESRD